MDLPYAPPPGLPLPNFDQATREEWIQTLSNESSFPYLPLLVLLLLVIWGASELAIRLKPKKKPILTWKEELLDPYLQEPSAPLTTSEILVKIFKKDPDLAEKVEPLLQEIDLMSYSSTPSDPSLIDPLIDRTKNLFIPLVPKLEIKG